MTVVQNRFPDIAPEHGHLEEGRGTALQLACQVVCCAACMMVGTQLSC